MKASERVAWITLISLAALVLFCWFATWARASERPLTLVDRLVREQPQLASRKDEAVDPLALAQAIAAVPHVTGEWAALMLTVAAHESALSARIARGECKRFECDHGLAWGLWQGHRNQINAAQWGSPDVNVQALAAARALRGAFYTCNPKGLLRADWALTTLRAYAGRKCTEPLLGEEKRLVTFNHLRGRL